MLIVVWDMWEHEPWFLLLNCLIRWQRDPLSGSGMGGESEVDPQLACDEELTEAF